MKENSVTTSIPHVLVTIPTANYIQRRILEGILAYARERGPWQFHLNTGDVAGSVMKRVTDWGCSGIIVLSSNQVLMKRILRLRLPTVFINPPTARCKPPKNCVFIRRDNRNLGRLAAEHFLSAGFRSFAFVGASRPAVWSDERREGFISCLKKAGKTCLCYGPTTPEECADAALETPRLVQWLTTLPRQTALFTVKDIRGLQILSACLDARINVPNHIAVLSADNDEILCETATPPLSSISLDGENIGRLCAKALDNLLHQRRTEPIIDLAYPQIVTRRSTDVTAVDDPILARALRYAQDHLAESFRIADLARETGMSVRTIELKARKNFGHSFRDEILRLRLSKVIALLSNTELGLADIAEETGFCSASHLSRVVKATFHYPPGVFRMRFLTKTRASNPRV